jgi:SAM-dependent methyltransferase
LNIRKMNAFSDLNARAYETAQALKEYSESAGLFPVEQALIAEFFNRQSSILDIGCGAGRTTSSLANLGFEVIGVDLSKALVETARNKCPDVEFHQADVQRLPFRNEQFDQALFSDNGFDYVHPLEGFIRGLNEINRVLKPSGIVIYSGHNIIGRFGRHLRSVREFVSSAVRVHPGYLSLQLRGSQPWRWYWRYKEPFGEVITLSAPPWVHKRLHSLAGFETIAIRCPNNGKSERWITWREHHVNYVIRKLI